MQRHGLRKAAALAFVAAIAGRWRSRRRRRAAKKKVTKTYVKGVGGALGGVPITIPDGAAARRRWSAPPWWSRASTPAAS